MLILPRPQCVTLHLHINNHFVNIQNFHDIHPLPGIIHDAVILWTRQNMEFNSLRKHQEAHAKTQSGLADRCLKGLRTDYSKAMMKTSGRLFIVLRYRIMHLYLSYGSKYLLDLSVPGKERCSIQVQVHIQQRGHCSGRTGRGGNSWFGSRTAKPKRGSQTMSAVPSCFLSS